MLVGTEQSLLDVVDGWLSTFETALEHFDRAAFDALFVEDSHWRDVLAFTWDVRTTSGAADIVAILSRRTTATKARNFEVDRNRTPPRLVTRTGKDVIEAIFRFDTACGPAEGVVRLVSGESPKAWTLLTALADIAGHKESIGDHRPSGEIHSRDFSGPNWLDRRQMSAAYEDRDPAVLIVGGGQAGLSIAARLTQLNVDTLIFDQEERIGDNWRKRYHALTLHNQVHVNHLPYMPFPPNWPTYIPKDKIANWFEAYAESMELNFWTQTAFEGAKYDEERKRWNASLRLADGTLREMHPRHIVMAVGVSSIPNIPGIPVLKNFKGEVLHSGQYGDAADWSGKNVLVIGTGTSGHDIAQDLHSHGATVTMAQRSPTLIVGIEPSAQLPYALYGEGPPLEDNDLLTVSFPFPMLKAFHQQITEQTKIHDRKLLESLKKIGFQLDFGPDGAGWQFKYLERGGGYYFNVGCSDLLVDGKIGLIQFDDIRKFDADGLSTMGGETLPLDLVVLATGYKGQEYMVRELFGNDAADRVGRIWGFDPELQELRNMWVKTGQPGLWFLAGSFAQCRIYSRYLGLQIKACEEGLIPIEREKA